MTCQLRATHGIWKHISPFRTSLEKQVGI
jgi:hypothetical protein